MTSSRVGVQREQTRHQRTCCGSPKTQVREPEGYNGDLQYEEQDQDEARTNRFLLGCQLLPSLICWWMQALVAKRQFLMNAFAILCKITIITIIHWCSSNQLQRRPIIRIDRGTIASGNAIGGHCWDIVWIHKETTTPLRIATLITSIFVGGG